MSTPERVIGNSKFSFGSGSENDSENCLPVTPLQQPSATKQSVKKASQTPNRKPLAAFHPNHDQGATPVQEQRVDVELSRYEAPQEKEGPTKSTPMLSEPEMGNLSVYRAIEEEPSRGRALVRQTERGRGRPESSGPSTSMRSARRSASPSSRLLQATKASSLKTNVRSRSHSPAQSRPTHQGGSSLTIPQSPTLRTHYRERSRGPVNPKMSTTSRELLEIKSHLEKMRVDRKKAEALRQQAQCGMRGLTTVARSVKPLTMPSEPVLRTSIRAKHCDVPTPTPAEVSPEVSKSLCVILIKVGLCTLKCRHPEPFVRKTSSEDL